MKLLPLALGLALIATTTAYAQSGGALSGQSATIYCNKSDVLDSQGGSDRSYFPLLECQSSRIVIKRSAVSFPITVVKDSQVDGRGLGAACKIAKDSGAEAIVDSLSSLCAYEYGPRASQCAPCQ